MKTIEVVEKGRGRIYLVDGVKMPSVTTVLSVINKPALIPWAKKITLESVHGYLLDLLGKKVKVDIEWIETVISESKKASDIVKAEAADIGTQTHEAIACHLKGLPIPPLSEMAQNTFGLFLEWKKENQFEVLYIEEKVYSEKYGYAGTADLVGRMKGGAVFVSDWKSSKDGRVYPEAALQVAAYAQAVSECLGLKVDTGLVLGLGKETAVFKPHILTNLDSSFNSFMGALTLYNGLNKSALEEMITTTEGKLTAF